MAETEVVHGILKRIDKQQYAVRTAERSYRPRHPELLLLPELARQYPLVEGASITGRVEQKKGKPKLVAVETLGGLDPAAFAKRPRYSDLVAVDPYERFDLGCNGQDSMRIVDLIAPIGKGSRQLIVSPPKAGKTVMLEQMALAIRQCSPETRVMVLLLDERPEEVTHFRRATEGAEILASTSDRTADEHVELAELVLAHVQIELECGHETVLMIDSLTRMGRAFNNRTRRGGGSRPTMSGGLEAGVLEVPRRVFGLARRAEEGGSVTIVATCLVDTGSRMDQLIFEEFKGTGNSELILDRKLAEARIWPAINLPASGTRKEAKLYSPQESRGLSTLRRVLSSYEPQGAMDALHKLLNKYPTNKEFLENMSHSQ
jgi:transcription termination factor Rho